jgi:hypothetical protein
MCAGRGRTAPCNISNCKNNLANFCTRPTGGARQNFNILIDLIFGLQMRSVPNRIQFRGERGGKGGNLCFGLRKTHKISVTRSTYQLRPMAFKSEHYSIRSYDFHHGLQQMGNWASYIMSTVYRLSFLWSYYSVHNLMAPCPTPPLLGHPPSHPTAPPHPNWLLPFFLAPPSYSSTHPSHWPISFTSLPLLSPSWALTAPPSWLRPLIHNMPL